MDDNLLSDFTHFIGEQLNKSFVLLNSKFNETEEDESIFVKGDNGKKIIDLIKVLAEIRNLEYNIDDIGNKNNNNGDDIDDNIDVDNNSISTIVILEKCCINDILSLINNEVEINKINKTTKSLFYNVIIQNFKNCFQSHFFKDYITKLKKCNFINLMMYNKLVFFN